MNSNIANPSCCTADYFRQEDWCSLALTTALVFFGYWLSLADNVGLDSSGIYSVGANYLGVPAVPGFPIWTIYGWLFAHFFPFSNIAWRLAVSSAAAAGLACGVIALMVSRSSATLITGIPRFQKLSEKDSRVLRMAAGCIAGMTFGFNREFWRTAVTADVWPLTILLFTIVLCLLLRWGYNPKHKSLLLVACFVFGLTITNSQALIPAGLGLLLFVVFADHPSGRDAALAGCCLLAIWWFAGIQGVLSGANSMAYETKLIYGFISLLTLGLYVGLATQTHSWLPTRMSIFTSLLFLTGVVFYLLVPVFSMSNPPVNWGYPRTTMGFVHVLSRGQFERVQPVSSGYTFLTQLWHYVRCTGSSFGLLPSLCALIPFGFLLQMQPTARRQMFGLLSIFLSLSLLVIALLNPPPDRQATELVAPYYTPSHLLLSVWMGYGLVILGTRASRFRCQATRLCLVLLCVAAFG